MKLKIRPMDEVDIPRVLELMTRTHQLNTTGRLMEREELQQIFCDTAASTRIIVAELEDMFGGYGCIGTAMVQNNGHTSRLIYLAVSCRVMGRGIERSILAWIARRGQQDGKRWLEAEFRDTGKNRIMRALYLMEGLRNEKEDAGTFLFRGECARIPDAPTWVEVV